MIMNTHTAWWLWILTQHDEYEYSHSMMSMNTHTAWWVWILTQHDEYEYSHSMMSMNTHTAWWVWILTQHDEYEYSHSMMSMNTHTAWWVWILTQHDEYEYSHSMMSMNTHTAWWVWILTQHDEYEYSHSMMSMNTHTAWWVWILTQYDEYEYSHSMMSMNNPVVITAIMINIVYSPFEMSSGLFEFGTIMGGMRKPRAMPSCEVQTVKEFSSATGTIRGKEFWPILVRRWQFQTVFRSEVMLLFSNGSISMVHQCTRSIVIGSFVKGALPLIEIPFQIVTS